MKKRTVMFLMVLEGLVAYELHALGELRLLRETSDYLSKAVQVINIWKKKYEIAMDIAEKQAKLCKNLMILKQVKRVKEGSE